jgi:two-component system, LuxR family, response regulator FixJ
MGDGATIHIIDDNPSVRESLALLVSTEGHVCHTYFSAQAFLDAIDNDATGCVVTDVRMPGMSGLDLLAKMKERRVSMPVIVITAHGDVPLAVAAMKQGAVDFFAKPFDGGALLASIRAALTRGDGEPASDPEIQMPQEKLASLTKREKEVLAGLLKGQQNKNIADELGLSVRTVEFFRAKVMAKTQATSLAELMKMALTDLEDTERLEVISRHTRLPLVRKKETK